MKEHCVINGVRCSKCCEVLTIRSSKTLRDLMFDRNDHPDGIEVGERPQRLLRPISKRRAKLLNPTLVSVVNNDQSYFTCKNFTGDGCADYDNRPAMCANYPYYGRSEQEWKESEERQRGGLYHIECTFYE